ncbi:MAG: GNAT family N-acetyltransferase [Pseudomonadota bacterium]
MNGPSLPIVRRLEAVGLRAWPSQHSKYDGAWLYRLSPTQDGRRINCVTPLDPGDDRDIEQRLSQAATQFHEASRPLIIRQTPLIPERLMASIEQDGWTSEGASVVQSCPLAKLDLSSANEQLPFKDIGRWSEQFTLIRQRNMDQAAPLAEAIAGIEADVGLFLMEADDGTPLATVMAVHDGDMVGLFEVAVATSAQRRGLAKSLVLSSLRWAKMRGAKTAWLQVEADNEPALGLYGSLGFTTVYPYRYWRAP